MVAFLTYKATNRGITIEGIQFGEKETLASVNNMYDNPRAAKYTFNPNWHSGNKKGAFFVHTAS